MKTASFNMLLQTASRHNILILTTKCATSCIFCSHSQNPDDIDVYSAKAITMDEFYNLIEFLDENKRITIGESATRICEGEPFMHPDIIAMLQILRQRFTDTIIQITTSAVYLTEEILSRLSEMQNIELNISLNSSCEDKREILYKGKIHMEAVAAIRAISKYNIKYSGSIVAMPHLVGYEDIQSTVKFLSQNGAETIRIFKPGITKYSRLPQLPEDIEYKLSALIINLRKEVSTPIILEPPIIASLDAEVIGVIKGSGAYEAGILAKDIILKVNNKKVISRVDAFNKIYKAHNPLLRIQRNGQDHDITINKDKNTTSGLVFEYDIHQNTIMQIKQTLKKHHNKKCLIVTSELGYNAISLWDFEADNYSIAVIKNSFFGGNIKSAGLLVVSDILDGIKSSDSAYDVIIMPAIMFDDSGRDLTGVHYKELEDRYQIEII